MGGKNDWFPIGIIVPCHRVIAKDGRLGGYAWGIKMKAKLLDIEVRGMADSIYRGGKWITESAPAWMLTEQ